MITEKGNDTSCVILLVEDDPAHAELVKRGFDRDSLRPQIIHVAHGEAALDYLFRRGDYAEVLPYPLL